MRILGIDPGLATTGWAVVDFDDNSKPEIVDYGCILTEKGLSVHRRLKEIYDDTLEILSTHEPEYAGIETLLFCNNAKTGIVVGEARGVILLALEESNVLIKEFTPLQVKNSITGYGKANKMQIQENVKLLYGLEELPKPDDAADALAIAMATEVLVSRDNIISHYPV